MLKDIVIPETFYVSHTNARSMFGSAIVNVFYCGHKKKDDLVTTRSPSRSSPLFYPINGMVPLFSLVLYRLYRFAV